MREWENERMERISRKGNMKRNDRHFIIMVSKKTQIFLCAIDPFTTLGNCIPISPKGYLGRVKSRVKRYE